MFTGAALLAGSMGSFADTAIIYADEDITGGLFQVSNHIHTFNLSAPFICGYVLQTMPTGGEKLIAQFPGSIPGNGNFLFGPLIAGSQAPVSGLGAWTFSPAGGLVVSPGDPYLSCYSLTNGGARKPTSGLFSDTFDQPYADAKVALRVVQLPNFGNGFVYRYYIDVNIPAISSAVDVPFSIQDGYDASVFNAPTSSAGAGYCAVEIGETTCENSVPQVIHENVVLPIVRHPGDPAYSKRFIVSRPLRSDVSSLPNTGRALVLAAVFSQNGLEDRLDNNVSQGYGSLSDFDPVVTTTGTNLSGLSEGGILPGVTFSLSDDTTESAGELLDAQVTVDFNGTLVPATTNCGSTAPNPGPGSSRTCSFDVVPPSSNFATDVNAGTYASGVYANVVITATDPAGHSTTKSLPLHIASSDNDAPTFTLSPAAVPDPTSDNMPTLRCNLARDSGSVACVGLVADIASNMKGGPADAPDELASQGTWLATQADGTLACSNTSIFTVNGRPKYVISGGHADLDYRLNTIVMGETICNVTLVDSGPYPSGQVYNELTKQIRILIVSGQ